MASTNQPYHSIGEIQDAIQQGKTTVKALTQTYLQTIKEKDGDLNAIITVNPRAMEEAERLDNLPPAQRGPLHGIPLILKDQLETAGLRTTYGSAACADHIPTSSATVVRKLQSAGALILAKSTMCDWAAGWFSVSSLSGTTRHPFDGSRDPGGSSAGNGTAVAAGMAIAAIGGDTGGSVRLPASFCGLVGVRVTPGRISRAGMSALLTALDTPGPMTWTVGDAAGLLDVMVGFDPEDEYTAINAWGSGKGEGEGTRFADAVARPRLEGRRLGVLRQVFGSHRGIVGVMEETLKALTGAGAELVEVEVPDLEHYLTHSSTYILQSKADINGFLASRESLAHLKIEDLHRDGIYHKSLDTIETLVKGPTDPTQSPHFGRSVVEGQKFQRALGSLFAQHNLDAVIYPTCQVLAPKTQDLLDKRWDSPGFPTNTSIASQALFTAVSVPVGKAKDDEYPDDPELPVGLEILGVPLSEERILNIAAGIETLR